jgi:acyl dehydratase
MALSSSIVEATLPSLTHRIDERWLMAFAAGVGDARPELIDTARVGGIIAHPLFAIAIEWPSYVELIQRLIQLGLDPDEGMMATPFDYDLAIHRVVQPDEELQVRMKAIGLRTRRDGVVLTVRTTIVDREERIVSSSKVRMLFGDVELDGREVAHRSAVTDPAIDLRSEWSNPDAVIRRGHRRVGTAAAHVFSACSGVWNPLHTDRAIALEHGLPGVTMPQAGVLAMAVGGALQLASAEPGWVRRVRSHFGAPVPVPSTLEIEAEVPNHPTDDAPIRFRANLEDGTPVITSGVMVAVPIDREAAALARARDDRRGRVGVRSALVRAPLY